MRRSPWPLVRTGQMRGAPRISLWRRLCDYRVPPLGLRLCALLALALLAACLAWWLLAVPVPVAGGWA